MKFISVLTFFNAVIWGLLIGFGRTVIATIAEQHAVGYPNYAQIALWFYFPIIVFCVALSACYFARKGRWRGFIVSLEGAILLMAFPFVMTVAGGV